MSKFHFTKENANSQLNDYINVMFEQRLRAKKNNEPLNDEKYVKETDEMLEEYFLIMEQYPPSNYLDRIGTLLMFGFVSSNSKNKMDEDYAFETERLQRDREGMVFPSTNTLYRVDSMGKKSHSVFYNDELVTSNRAEKQSNLLDFNSSSFNPTEEKGSGNAELDLLFQKAKLKPREKELIKLHFLHQMSIGDISKLKKWTKSTVHQFLTEGVEKLQRYTRF